MVGVATRDSVASAPIGGNLCCYTFANQHSWERRSLEEQQSWEE